MSLFRRIHTKHLKSLTQRMDEFTDANVGWNKQHPWQPWFAWYPVKVKGRWTWFKKVYRKYNWAKSSSFPFGDEYDYGDIFDVLKHD